MRTKLMLVAAALGASPRSAGAGADAGGRRCQSPSTTSSAPSPISISAASSRMRRRSAKFIHRREPARDRQPDRDPPQPRHALFVGGVRSRRRAGDDHAAGRRQALHVAAGDQRGSLRAGGVLRRRQPHARPGRRSARAMSRSAIRTLVDPDDPKDLEAGPRAAGRDQGQPEGSRASSRCRTGIRRARRRCAMRCWCSAHDARLQEGVRHQGGGRSDPPSDRHRRGLGRQSRQGRDLSQRHAGEE